MPHLHSLPLRRAITLAAIAGVAAISPAAMAAPATKSKAARSASADLTVRDLEVEFAGETLEIYADVANIGKARAAKRTDAVVVISGDETFDEDDEVLDETRVRKLRQNRTFEVATEVDIPADEDLPEGDVYLLLCADGSDELREKNEGNNCSAELIASADDSVADDDESSDDDSASGESDDEGEDFPVSEER